MEYLEKICCFFIFARVFLRMCPNETYEKYLSALTSWVAFCIFLSPFLSGDLLWENYQTWEGSWKTQLEQTVNKSAEELEERSGKAATEIAVEIGEEYETKSDR